MMKDWGICAKCGHHDPIFYGRCKKYPFKPKDWFDAAFVMKGCIDYQKIRGCSGKIRHASKPDAEAAMKNLKRRVGTRGKTLNVYFCKNCNGYHVGNSK